MSRFEGTTCDSCGVSISETQKTGWAEVVFWGLGKADRFDLCPECAARVSRFIVDGCERTYEKDQNREAAQEEPRRNQGRVRGRADQAAL